MYYASIKAVDTSGNASSITTGDGWQNLSCPTGFIKVIGNETPGLGGSGYVKGTATGRSISDFCVAKYEMKEVGDVATSQPSNAPWGNVSQTFAIAKCDDANFSLINNAEWQAIARDIENTASNWSGGTVGDGILNRGHTDDDPDDACDASNAFVGGSCSNTGNADSHHEKRTHTLSNGEIIWDLAGNVAEWVLDDLTTDIAPSPPLLFGGDTEFNDSNDCDGSACFAYNSQNRKTFGPSNLAFSSSHEIGRFSMASAAYPGGLYRGGEWNANGNAGIFAASINNNTSHDSGFIGFRCTYRP